MSKKHYLKTVQPYFTQVLSHKKDFELRKDDRNFKVGEILVLEEFVDGMKTGATLHKRIKYILRDCPEYGLKEGFCILGLK